MIVSILAHSSRPSRISSKMKFLLTSLTLPVIDLSMNVRLNMQIVPKNLSNCSYEQKLFIVDVLILLFIILCTSFLAWQCHITVHAIFILFSLMILLLSVVHVMLAFIRPPSLEHCVRWYALGCPWSIFEQQGSRWCCSFRQFSGWCLCRSETTSRPAFNFFLSSYIFLRERFLIKLIDFKTLLRIINRILYKPYG